MAGRYLVGGVGGGSKIRENEEGKENDERRQFS